MSTHMINEAEREDVYLVIETDYSRELYEGIKKIPQIVLDHDELSRIEVKNITELTGILLKNSLTLPGLGKLNVRIIPSSKDAFVIHLLKPGSLTAEFNIVVSEKGVKVLGRKAIDGLQIEWDKVPKRERQRDLSIYDIAGEAL